MLLVSTVIILFGTLLVEDLDRDVEMCVWLSVNRRGERVMMTSW